MHIVPIFIPTMGSGIPPFIMFTQTAAIDAGSSVGTVVGSAQVGGRLVGTPSWSLTASASGTYAIAAGTGIVTIASTNKLVAESESITIAVSGITPASTAKTFSIVVQSTLNTAAGSYFWLGF